jgi:arsenite-transporting ATPase
MKKLFRVERSIAKIVRPVAKRVYDIPLPGDDYFAAVEYLFERLRGVDRILIDPHITTVRLVTNPEKIVLKETQRAFMYFCLYKMHIDAIIVNRILPDNIKDAYFKSWKKSQKQYIEKAKEYFKPIPIFLVPLLKEEVLGYERLKDLADQIYEGQNPLTRFFEGEPYRLIKNSNEYQIMIKLPFIEKKDIELNKSSDELIVRMGNFKRHLLLPRQVAATRSVKAKLMDNYLCIFFKGDERE